MSDWDAPLKIGSNHNGSTRETVVRGNSKLNAAMRTGSVVATEKKYAVGNAATKSTTEGQRLTKVDRSDDIVKLNTIGIKVGKAIAAARNNCESPLAKRLAAAGTGEAKSVTQSDLAKAIGIKVADLQKFETGDAVRHTATLQQMEKLLGVKLTGSEELLGKPLKPRGKGKSSKTGGDSTKGKGKGNGK
ncbi:MAG: multiprotein-bridging factor 1 [Geoglossum simile]|nr:MAG: multiprotein-bridging factor 1 [Geoglossum simile]